MCVYLSVCIVFSLTSRNALAKIPRKEKGQYEEKYKNE